MRDKVKLCPSQNVKQNFQGVSNKKSFVAASKIHLPLEQAEHTKCIGLMLLRWQIQQLL